MVELSQQERRGAPRVDLDLSGIIRSSDLHASLPCIVRDISETGARLQVESVDYIPDAFQLQLEQDRFSAECIVVWRSRAEVGVIFETAPQR